MISLQNKTVLITGASSGIGWATAQLLARLGARLALAARREDRLQTLARELKTKYGQDALILRTDVGRKEDVASMIQAAHRRLGRLDVLINNAGILHMEPFLTMPLEKMQDLMNTNYWSLVHSIREAAPLMAEQGGGHIINIGSGVSRRGLPFMAGYCASKFAVAGLTESIRLELASKNVHFTNVYPGGVETEMPRNLDRSKLPPGYPHGSRGRVSAERAARAVARAIRAKPLEIYVPWWVRPTAWVSVLFPSVADRIIRMGYKDCLMIVGASFFILKKW